MQFFKPNGYDTAEVLPESGGRARLPKGGYVCKILTVEPMESRNGNPYLLFNLDIAEGEYMGHFADDYASQTGDKKWHFTHRLMIPTDNANDSYFSLIAIPPIFKLSVMGVIFRNGLNCKIYVLK